MNTQQQPIVADLAEGSVIPTEGYRLRDWVLPLQVQPRQLRDVAIGLNDMPWAEPQAAYVPVVASNYVSEPVHVRPPLAPTPRFDALQKWEGRVLEVGDESFFAIVIDLEDPRREEQVELDITEISDDDQPLLVPCQATFARLMSSRSVRSWALRFRQAM